VNYTGRFQLARGSELFPASQVEPRERARIGCDADDFVLTRQGSRQGSRVIEARMAHVLARLVKPSRIVDAILSVSEEYELDPETTLDEAIPGLTRLMAEGFLVPVESKRSRQPPSLYVGTRIDGWEVLGRLHVMDDTAVYQACHANGSVGALKISSGRPSAEARIANERSILERVGVACAPRLVASGAFRKRSYVVIEWCCGINVATMASELRAVDSIDSRLGLVRLCAGIADAYADLHEAGIVHGDVHDGNLLVDAKGVLTVLDYGIARDLHDPFSAPPRGAAGFNWDPEYAAAVLGEREPPPATPPGEQFTVAALVFELVTGSPYAEFPYEARAALRAVVGAQPRTFGECGVEPWPALERVLEKALSKRPQDRYATTRAFAAALYEAGNSATRARAGDQRRHAVRRNKRLGSWIGDLGSLRGGAIAGVGRAPTASVAYGAAGVACVLLRLARLEANPRCLAAADAWAEHAVWWARRDRDTAFGDADLPAASISPASLYFSEAGVHVVRALVGLARGQPDALRHATRALQRLSLTESDPADLALGLPGLVLGCALLLDATPPSLRARTRRLTTLGDRLAERTRVTIETSPSIAPRDRSRNLGVAHGWAGLLYAMLRWSSVAHRDLPNEVHVRLEQLAATGTLIGRGVRFPWRTDADVDSPRPSDERYMSGWCNGSAGFVHLWLAAGNALESQRFYELAELSAWHAWEDDSEDDASLCCGFPGRAYALLAWYRHTNDMVWLRRASELVGRAIGTVDRDVPLDAGLLKGQLSLALVERELSKPQLARMPLFEPDGWTSRTGGSL